MALFFALDLCFFNVGMFSEIEGILGIENLSFPLSNIMTSSIANQTNKQIWMSKIERSIFML